MATIQLLAHPGSLPSTSFLKGVDIASTIKSPFFVMLRLDQFHLAPQGVAPVPSGVTHTWWAAYTKKGTSDKLKAVKALLGPLIVEMPSLNEEDESVAASRAAMTGLQTSLGETPTGADEEEEEPPATFQMAQTRPTVSGKAPKSKKERVAESSS